MPSIFLKTAVAVAAFVSSSQASGVLTSSGTINGHQASNRTSVTEFLGIKYANGPRFGAPTRYEAPEGTVYEAAEWVSSPVLKKIKQWLTSIVTVCCIRCIRLLHVNMFAATVPLISHL